jgi:predicted AAA+ superfamily ATPase
MKFNVPDLLSYLQLCIDEKNTPGLYVITGSQNLFLNQKITQTLAGRIEIATLLPLSYQELQPDNDWKKKIYKGFFPRVYNSDINPDDFYPNYIQTYIEKEVRQIKSIVNLSLFQTFLGLCAGRIGQILNLHSLANDCGIPHSTAREWMSILEMIYIVYLLKPHFNNFNKILIKSPKLYF